MVKARVFGVEASISPTPLDRRVCYYRNTRLLIHYLFVYSLAALALTTGFTIGIGETVWLDNVHCEGNESRLIDCLANPLGSHDCATTDAAGVSCANQSCTQGGIRLQAGTATSGRVEVCNNNIWGTVCNTYFGVADAKVACRQLGLPSSSTDSITSKSGPIIENCPEVSRVNVRMETKYPGCINFREFSLYL